MKINLKITVLAGLVLILGAVYLFSKRTSSEVSEVEEVINIGSENLETESKETEEIPVTPGIQATPTNPIVTTPSSEVSMSKYKGQFFPFEFSYPQSLRLAKNQKASTSELESQSYNFTRLSFDGEVGGVGGYVSFYVERDNDDERYEDLVKEYPDKYSIVQINGYKFFKHVEIYQNSNSEFRAEYVTFKDGIRYRFALVAVNDKKKVVDIKTYQNELLIMEMIIKSFKINS